jgi:hypothetical protein
MHACTTNQRLPYLVHAQRIRGAYAQSRVQRSACALVERARPVMPHTVQTWSRSPLGATGPRLRPDRVIFDFRHAYERISSAEGISCGCECRWRWCTPLVDRFELQVEFASRPAACFCGKACAKLGSPLPDLAIMCMESKRKTSLSTERAHTRSSSPPGVS